jgi:hypothetical protein
MAYIDKIGRPPGEHYDQPVSSASGAPLWVNDPVEEGGLANIEDYETQTVVGGW